MEAGPAEEDDDLASKARARVGIVLQDRWTLVRLIGLGGAAAVYEAQHRNGKRAAIKVLHALYAGNEDMRTRFLREGYVANKIEHPGVVSVLDDGIDATGAAFLVMELLNGQSLEDRRERSGGRLPANEVLEVLEAVLDVLRVAHREGVVHRDLKPENLFRTGDGQIKVLDFGIARLLERSAQASATSSHAYMGTPAFMPPEQASARWKDVDARTDVWALGATAHMLATGSYVHEGGTVMEMLAMTIMHPARPTRERSPFVPPSLAEVIDRALAFHMKDRYPSADAMLLAVRSAKTRVEEGFELGDSSPRIQAPSSRASSANTVMMGAPGSVSDVQRLGSVSPSNPYFHIASPDSVDRSVSGSIRGLPQQQRRSSLPVLLGASIAGLVLLSVSVGYYVVHGRQGPAAQGEPAGQASSADRSSLALGSGQLASGPDVSPAPSQGPALPPPSASAAPSVSTPAQSSHVPSGSHPVHTSAPTPTSVAVPPQTDRGPGPLTNKL